MQSDRIAGARDEGLGPPGPGFPQSRVLGLGVTDALRIELEACQVSWLVDEIGVLRDVVEDTLVHERERWDSLSDWARRVRVPEAVEVEKELDRIRYEARVLEMIRGQVAGRPGGGRPVVVFGPSEIVAELVRGAARHVVEVLGELLQRAPGGRCPSAERVGPYSRGGAGVDGDLRRLSGDRVVQLRA